MVRLRKFEHYSPYNYISVLDDLEFYSVRHLSAARYQRNQKLMQEIFNDNVVPDLRTVVTTQRLQGWKRQVETLMLHQVNLK